jgi:hypothetical protein
MPEFRVLGCLDVVAGGAPVPLGNRAAAESSLRQCLALCAELDLPEERALALRLLGELRARPPGARGRAG